MDLSWVDSVIGGLLVLTAYKVGECRERSRKPEISEKEAVCGCEHHFSFHDENGCHADDEESEHFDRERDIYVMDRCKCKRYTGPEPLPDFYA
jgi:hypothetical protein